MAGLSSTASTDLALVLKGLAPELGGIAQTAIAAAPSGLAVQLGEFAGAMIGTALAMPGVGQGIVNIWQACTAKTVVAAPDVSQAFKDKFDQGLKDAPPVS